MLAALVHFDPETETDSRVVWYENVDGAGNYSTARLISTDPSGARSIQAADMDGDGDADVVMSVIYENELSGTRIKMAKVVSVARLT